MSLKLMQSMYYWTDSMITLCWITSSMEYFRRSPSIQTSTEHSQIEYWWHVPDDINLADLISRGIILTDI